LENILIPVADWAANSVLPALLNILGAAFLVLNDALLKLQPIALWIWENFLKPIAEWTGGVIVTVLTAIGDWIREHKDTLSTVVAIAIALYTALNVIPLALSLISGALGVLATVITSPITWITALIALFVTLYDECEGFRAGMDKAWEGIKGIFEGAVDFIKALFKGDWAGMSEAWEKIKTSGKDLLTGLWEGLKAGWEWIKDKLKTLWEKISKAFCKFFGINSPSTLFIKYGKYMMQGLRDGIKAVISSVIDTCKNLWTKIKNVFSSVTSWFKNKFKDAGSNIASAFTGALSKIKNACKKVWSAIKDVFSNVTSWFKDKFTAAWTAVKNVFSKGGKIFSGIKDGISSTFKTIVNGLISGINKIIATPFNSINSMLNKIRSVSVLGIQPFAGLWRYNPLSVPKIPKLALGGIVNRPGRGVPAIIGEAGAEAVLPLENNTEWMDILADKINGSGTITIPIYMDGKKIYTYMVDIGKRKAFAANGG
jgi:phage-related protein